ncbi:PREDICTED: odorant-binding protein 2b-like [Elephantulus edwardii]|uniref:odorant-binding protein 2b-like n=1 Tax=Elephantulus edwardii TaxID=28737 RepID=UPI0003F0EE34|nr:PREDICTED: odorant-binding protein 2b-like [Elephantulus edwardii]
MLTLFLTILLSLTATLQAQDPWFIALEEQNVTGTWYITAIVIDSDLPWEKVPKKVSPLTLTALTNGDLETSFTFMKNDRCYEKRIILEKQGETGQYSAFGGKKHIEIHELPKKDYYIIYCESNCNGKTWRMAKLVGKNPDMNVEAMEEFHNFTQQKGFLQKNIFTPAQTDSPTVSPSDHTSAHAMPLIDLKDLR